MLTEVLARLGSTPTAVVTAVASMVAIYLAVVVATRVAGPRSLAQMSAFDFIATVAVGSMTASVGLGSVPLVDGVVAVATLFALQFVVGLVRRTRVLRGAIDNQPLLLVRDGEVLEDHLRAARLTHDDLRSHLRSADVTDLRAVRAVVLETTGAVSVLQGDGDLGPILQGVRGADGHAGPHGQLSGG
jgi:uncharacterized membrane protein YcaP (DUF421 family)